MRKLFKEVVLLCLMIIGLLSVGGCMRAPSLKYLNITQIQTSTKLQVILINLDEELKNKTLALQFYNEFLLKASEEHKYYEDTQKRIKNLK